MVADDECRRKLLLLDQQLLNNDETVGGRDSSMVVMDTQRTVTQKRTKSNQAERFLIYWLWLCRQNPRDAEPKPKIV